MPRPILLAIFWCAAACCGTTFADDDPIKTKLEKAKVGYESAMKSFRMKVSVWLDDEEEAARKRGNKRIVDRIQEARRELEQSDRLPKETAPRLRREYASIRTDLIDAYDRAVRDYTKAGKDAEGTKAQEELDAFLKTSHALVFLSNMVPLRKRHLNDLFAANGMILGNKIIVQGKESPHGIFLHPPKQGISEVVYNLAGDWKTFRCGVAVPRIGDDAERLGIGSPITFEVVGDGRTIWRSMPLQQFDTPHWCEVNIEGITNLALRVHCPGDAWCARAVWLEPRVSTGR